MSTLLELVTRTVGRVAKVSSREGGEYHSPCPRCGGKDRFIVFPQQEGGKIAAQAGVLGTWACPRHCHSSGDAISFLTEFGGLSFRDACAELNIPLPDGEGDQPRPRRAYRKPPPPPQETLASYAPPSELWRAQATKLALSAHERLLETPPILGWLSRRGLPYGAVKTYRLGYLEAEDRRGTGLFRQRSAFGLPNEIRSGREVRSLWIPRGVTIPAWSDTTPPEALRIRIRRRNSDLQDGDSKYLLVKQPDPPYSAPLVLPPKGSIAALSCWVVVEAELDAMAVHFACFGLVGAISVLTVRGKPDALTHARLQQSARILVALDYDHATPDGWVWWRDHYPQARLWPVPKGKDPGEAFALGIDLAAWIRAGLPDTAALWRLGSSSGHTHHGGGSVYDGCSD